MKYENQKFLEDIFTLKQHKL